MIVLKPAYAPTTFQFQPFQLWSTPFKTWAGKFFAAFGPQFNKWCTAKMLDKPFISFTGGVIYRDDDGKSDDGLVLVTLNLPELLKAAGCSNVDELVRDVDPIDFANKCVASPQLSPTDSDFVDWWAFLVEFYITRMLGESTGWNLIYEGDPCVIFDSTVRPTPIESWEKQQGVTEPAESKGFRRQHPNTFRFYEREHS